MRQIGTLPSTTDPKVFGDYLLSLGVTSRAVQSKDGWAIWVHNEDQVSKARGEFEAYTENPNDPRYQTASAAAKAVRQEQDRLDHQYRKNVRDMKGRYDGLNARGRPLTVALLAVCIGLYLVGMTVPHSNRWLEDRFGFFSRETQRVANRLGMADAGLSDIRRGEVWRLVTPIFLHLGPMHLMFDMMAVWYLGTVIEYCRGTRTLAALTLLSAVTSNVGQYLYKVYFSQSLDLWFGISGVAYAMFGYIWVKGVNEPEQGIRLSQNGVRMMLLWLLVGFTGFLRMANGAHLSGLIVGMLFGLARF